MSLENDLKAQVAKVFSSDWGVRKGQNVPESKDIQLGNDAVELDATVLYADLDGSTNLVDNYNPLFAAEIYKNYLYCAAKLIRSQGGVITSYDGDRIMAIYVGGKKNTLAAKTALKINWMVANIINPAIGKYYDSGYKINQVVGIDTSGLTAARTGIRGSNDIVWVGRAANYAAKLTELSSDFPSWITDDVYRAMLDEAKYSSDGERPMWEAQLWTKMGNMRIYRSTWGWKI